jgi:PadR family transcriptional regulator, regulatory protein AphA
MDYNLVEKNEKKYIECIPGKILISSEQDALDFVAICGENNTHLLMINASNLSEDFSILKTRVAGSILLKFTNYYIKVAAVLTEELVRQGKFHDWVIETNRGRDFRVFYERASAESWLISD